MPFIDSNNIKKFNVEQNCENNVPSKKYLALFEFKLSNDTYSISTFLDPNGKIKPEKIKNPSHLHMHFGFEVENQNTLSQEDRLSIFKEKKKKDRLKKNKQ